MGRTRHSPALLAGAGLVAGLIAGLIVLPPTTALAHDGHDGHDHVVEKSIAAAAQEAAEDGPREHNVTLPTGFADVKAIGNVTEPTGVAFAPDGTAFVALKTGVIKSFDYDIGSGIFEPNADSTDFADLSLNVNNYWDRGLTGIAVDPQFGTAGHNFVYVNYTYNRDPRDNPPVVPKWGDPSSAVRRVRRPGDDQPAVRGLCGDGAGHPADRAAAAGLAWLDDGSGQRARRCSPTAASSSRSHASGDVVFGPDGKLYASAGDGASFDTEDYGQYANPCLGDPGERGRVAAQPGPPNWRATRSASTARSCGSTRSTDSPRSQATAGQWLVAYGQRNPWRLAFRPGTTELWSGDVGGSNWEEINRLPDATTPSTPVNRGWPCYEGAWTVSTETTSPEKTAHTLHVCSVACAVFECFDVHSFECMIMQ